MKKGAIADMGMLGVIESFQVKRQVLLSAAEAAEVILRVDDIIKAAPRYTAYERMPLNFSRKINCFISCLIGCPITV